MSSDLVPSTLEGCCEVGVGYIYPYIPPLDLIPHGTPSRQVLAITRMSLPLGAAYEEGED